MYGNLSRVIEVDIDEILPNRFQPRIQFDEEEILELSDSIKEHGVIQPLVVRPIGDKYEIIAGERRYKASVLAGKETVPVIVKNLNDKDSAEIALIENIQRKNLTPIEEALSYKKILDMGYITQENLATKLGKSQPAVANKIRLLNLSDEVQEALLENKISERHARSLLKLTTSKQQNEMLNRIINERLTVRKADEEIEKMKNNPSDESNDNPQKIIEKGEIDMNNNMFGMPNVPQNPQPNFDIFGGSAPEVPQSMPPAAPAAPQAPSFDIFGGNTVSAQPAIPSVPTFNIEPQPVVNAVPEVSVMPEIPAMQPLEESVPPVGPGLPGYVEPAIPSVPTFNVEPQPVVNAVPEVPMTPVMPEFPAVQPLEESVPPVGPGLPGYEAPTMPSVPTFNVEPQPVVNVVPEVPVMPEIPAVQPPLEESVPPVGPGLPGYIEPQQIIEVPQTAPIIESTVMPSVPTFNVEPTSTNTFSFGDNSLNSSAPVQVEVPSVPEFKMPEPIIITDYSKQYDPVMPVTPETITPTVDFKEVISAIRECSSKIEQYGFKIDVEEYDLANLYQVIFKIEK